MVTFCDIVDLRILILVCLAVFLPNSLGDEGQGAFELTSKNINEILESNELVLINFYADWCRFSKILAPQFNLAADRIRAAFPETGRVVVAKVDSEKESSIVSKFRINKYPTIKVIRNGHPTEKEYRGDRSVEGFETYVRKQLEDPIKEFFSLGELNSLDHKKRIIIGYFHVKEVPEYELFRKVASTLQEDCQFYVGFGFGDATGRMHPPNQPLIVFRSDKALSNDQDEIFTGSFHHSDELNIWAREKCIPWIREITFENAEELTEEGLPFFILFHLPDDIESIKLFKHTTTTHLFDFRHDVNFLTADGVKFAHPLHHLGKTTSDLPLIAIDSFRHMYSFSRFEDIKDPKKIRKFLQDFRSGILHQEFHDGPNRDSAVTGQVKVTTSPPESTFKKLAPSKNRYTLLKDEL